MAQPKLTSPKPFPKIVYVLLFLLLILFAFVILVMTVPTKPHFPPEPPEKIAMRLSPDNGFYAFERAATLMAPFEGSVDWGQSRDEYPEHWHGWTNDLEREAELLAHFERAKPASAEFRKGLNAEYYLLPEIGDLGMDLSYLKPWREMGYILTAQAKYLESQRKFSEAMENYLDTVRFGMIVRSDGTLVNGFVGTEIEGIGLHGLSHSLRQYEDKQLLQHALDTLKEIAETEPPPSRIFEFEFRTVENTSPFVALIAGSPPGANKPPGTGETFFSRAYSLLIYRSRAKYYREFLDAIDRPFLEYENNPPEIPGDPMSQIVFPAFSRAHEAFAGQQALLDGTMVAIVLRLYRIENGTYPESLDALVPTYLDSLPIDPFTGQPFIYSVGEDDFRLYGVGRNKIDDGGIGNWLEGDQIIHLPVEEWEAMEAEE